MHLDNKEGMVNYSGLDFSKLLTDLGHSYNAVIAQFYKYINHVVY